MKSKLFVILSLFPVGYLLGQAVLDFPENPRLSFDASSGAGTFVWDGMAEHTYFYQRCEDLSLGDWQWAPVVRGSATSETFSESFDSDASSQFFRLVRTDQFTEDVENADFDGDGVSNIDEVSGELGRTGLGPLNSSDIDSDGVPDDLESFDFIENPVPDGDGQSDEDGDGLTLREELLRGTNPALLDTDGDGVDDPEDAVGYDSTLSHQYAAGPGEATYVVIDLGRADSMKELSASSEY